MLFRKIRDWCVAIAIIGFVILAFNYFPTILGAVVLLALAALVIFIGIDAWRRGSIAINARTKFVVYYRDRNPVAFWFYIFLGLFFGALACVAVSYEILRRFGVF